MPIPKKCGNCQHHLYAPLDKDWICNNPDSELYTDWTSSHYVCPDWELKTESNGLYIRYYLTKHYEINEMPERPFSLCNYKEPFYMYSLDREVVGYADYDRQLSYKEEKEFGLIRMIDNNDKRKKEHG
jgi:hypothetical protein